MFIPTISQVGTIHTKLRAAPAQTASISHLTDSVETLHCPVIQLAKRPQFVPITTLQG